MINAADRRRSSANFFDDGGRGKSTGNGRGVFGRVGLEAVGSAERLATSGEGAAEWLLARVSPHVGLQMVRRREGLVATGSDATERTLARVSANVLTEITVCRNGRRGK